MSVFDDQNKYQEHDHINPTKHLQYENNTSENISFIFTKYTTIGTFSWIKTI